MRDQLLDTNELLGLKVEFHVCSMLLEVVEKLLPWCTHDIVDFIDLIELIIPWEKRKE